MHEVEKMMFTGRKPWWFGNTYQGEAVGIYVGETAVTAAEAILAAGLDWHVSKRRAQFEQSNGQWKVAEGEFFLVRDTDESVLGRCTDKYVPYQNSQVFSFMDSLHDEGLQYHTAGSLKLGQKIWVLGALPGKFQIGRLSGAVNTHYPFLLMIAGHDGVSGINLMPTEVRAECANTCGFAEHEAQSQKLHWSIPHTATAEAKLNMAAAAISEIPQAMVAQQEVLQELARQRMTRDEFIDFATSIFLMIDTENKAEVEQKIRAWYEDATDRSKTIMENKVAEVTKLFLKGEAAEGNSAYDALQAFTQAEDHRAITESKLEHSRAVVRMQNRVYSSWLGAGGKRKSLVMKRLRATL